LHFNIKLLLEDFYDKLWARKLCWVIRKDTFPSRPQLVPQFTGKSDAQTNKETHTHTQKQTHTGTPT